jgi:LmbE family N-acetylglucosaminyl deacetylase
MTGGIPAVDVLVITAHPDDVDYGAAGTVATWVAEGWRVAYCVVTSGDAGGGPAELSGSELAALREREQRAAAAIVGVEQVTFLRYPDGQVEPTLALREELTAQIRTHRPRIVLTHQPHRQIHRLKASHPDHLAVGEATLRAVYPDAGNARSFPHLAAAGLAPCEVAEVWLMAGRESNRWVDISAQLDRKVRAVLAHGSQHPQPERTAADLRRWAATIAAKSGTAAGTHAESFVVVAAGS